MTWYHAVILGIVEGLTEFLPISSTGHMIVTSSLMGIEKDPFTKLFEIVVQLGAILSVVLLYYKKFFDFTRWQFYAKLLIAVVPALLFGYLLSDKIDQLLESPMTVGISLLAGGVVLLFIDRVFTFTTIQNEERVSYMKAFTIGMWQVLAMIPGVSRSASSIIGGMQQRLTRKAAAEFSFFLAVPTMCAATGYKLLKAFKEQPEMLRSHDNLLMLAIGNIVALMVAILAIRTFLHYLQRNSFQAFGVYRIIAGIVILLLVYTHHI